MAIEIDFLCACTEWTHHEPFELPFAVECRCKCKERGLQEFRIHERPPEGCSARAHQSALSSRGWRHQVSFYPAAGEWYESLGWSVFTNGSRSALMFQDLVHLFLVESLVAEASWAISRGQPRFGGSSVLFENRGLLSNRLKRTQQVSVVDFRGRSFNGHFQNKEAFVLVENLLMLDGAFAAAWKGDNPIRDRWLSWFRGLFGRFHPRRVTNRLDNERY